MIELTSESTFELRGRQVFALTPPRELGNPREWLGQVISMDGRQGKVTGVEAYAIPDPTGTPIGLMLDFDLPRPS